jgi:hypothetical protein
VEVCSAVEENMAAPASAVSKKLASDWVLGLAGLGGAGDRESEELGWFGLLLIVDLGIWIYCC